MPEIKLSYFNGAGRAEAVRVAFALGGVPFHDERLQFPEIMARKAAGELPLGAVPTLTVDGVVMAQTASMLRYAAHLGAAWLYPSDPFKAFVVDSVIDTLNDTLSQAMAPSYRERDAEKRLAMRAEVAAGPLKQALGYIETLAAKFEGPFLTGSTMSIADIVVANQVLGIRSGYLDGLTNEHLAPFERVARLTDAYLAHPKIAALKK